MPESKKKFVNVGIWVKNRTTEIGKEARALAETINGIVFLLFYLSVNRKTSSPIKLYLFGLQQ